MPNVLRYLLIIVGLILVIDCIFLIAADKINFGTVVPFLLGMIFIAHGIFWPKIKKLLGKYHYLRNIWKTLWAGFGI